MAEAAPSLTMFEYDSDRLPSEERIGHWRHGLLSTHAVQLDERVLFHASGRVWKVGDFVLTGGTMSPQTLVRETETIRRDQIDHYGLFTLGSGSRIAIIDDTETRLLPGDLQLFDFSQPETSISLGGSSTTLYLPRDLIDGLLPGFSAYHGTVLRDQRATVLAHHLTGMHRYLGSIDPADVATLVEFTMSATIDTLQRALASMETDHTDSFRHRARIVTAIRARLTDPALSPAAIAAEFALSRSTLFRLFEADGGVERLIRRERLRAIRLHLLDEEDGRPVEELAFAYGFSTGWALTRSFREAYGVTPASLRRARLHAPHELAAVPSIRDIVNP